MKYMGDEKYWENKFLSRGKTPLMPEEVIVNNVNMLKKGSIIDIACGDGRNTLFLLENKFEVTGIDFSNEALKRLQNFSKEMGYSVTTKQVDISSKNSLDEMGVYDNILICHYRFQHMKKLKEHIKSNGILFITGFGHKHVCDEKIKKEDLIYEDDISTLYEDFELINYEEINDKRGFFVTYILVKK